MALLFRPVVLPAPSARCHLTVQRAAPRTPAVALLFRFRAAWPHSHHGCLRAAGEGSPSASGPRPHARRCLAVMCRREKASPLSWKAPASQCLPFISNRCPPLPLWDARVRFRKGAFHGSPTPERFARPQTRFTSSLHRYSTSARSCTLDPNWAVVSTIAARKRPSRCAYRPQRAVWPILASSCQLAAVPRALLLTPSSAASAGRLLRHHGRRRARTLSDTGLSSLDSASCAAVPAPCRARKNRCSLNSAPCRSHATCVGFIQPDSAAGLADTIARACRNGCGVVCGWWPSGGVPTLWLPCRTARPARDRRDPASGSRGNGTLKFRSESDETFRHSPARRCTLAPIQQPRRSLAVTIRSR